MSSSSIESVLTENRSFPPPTEFAGRAHVKSAAEYEALYARAASNPEGFWAEVAGELTWAERWKQVLEWKLPDAKWFVGGKLNLSVNCLDRHVATWRKNKAAILFEGEPGDTRVLTYGQLHREVCKAANALTALGIRRGDFVAIYLPMIPEAAIAMLACARIGAPHTVVFGGFSAEALRDRVVDAKAKLVITADGGWRRGQIVPLKDNVDRAVEGTAVEKVMVVRRCSSPVAWHARDVWWHDAVDPAPVRHTAPHGTRRPEMSRRGSSTVKDAATSGSSKVMPSAVSIASSIGDHRRCRGKDSRLRPCGRRQRWQVLELADLGERLEARVEGDLVGLEPSEGVAAEEPVEVELRLIAPRENIAHRQPFLERHHVRGQGEVNEILPTLLGVLIGPRGRRDPEVFRVDAGGPGDLEDGVLPLVGQLDLLGVELELLALPSRADVGPRMPSPGFLPPAQHLLDGHGVLLHPQSLPGREVAEGNGRVRIAGRGPVELETGPNCAGGVNQQRRVRGVEPDELVVGDGVAVDVHPGGAVDGEAGGHAHPRGVDVLRVGRVVVPAEVGDPPPGQALEQQVLERPGERDDIGHVGVDLVEEVRRWIDPVFLVPNVNRQAGQGARDEVPGAENGGDLQRLTPADAGGDGAAHRHSLHHLRGNVHRELSVGAVAPEDAHPTPPTMTSGSGANVDASCTAITRATRAW